MPLQGETSRLFLTEEKGRKDVEPSPLAVKAIAKAPPNLAIYDNGGNPHEVVDHVLKVIRGTHSAYMGQWTAMQKQWQLADNMYWMNQKEELQTELTRAKVSGSSFYRVTRRLADGAYLASFAQEELPIKFFPDIGIFETPETKQQKAAIAEAINRWAIYCARRTRLKEKARKSYTFVYKYADTIAYTPYDYQIEKRKKWQEVDQNEPAQAPDGTLVFRHKETGEVAPTPHPSMMKEVETDEVVKDEVGFYPISIDKVFLDNRIEDLDRQTQFEWRTDITRAEIWAEAKAGKWKNIEKITQLQQYQQYDWENFAELQRIRDAGKTTTDSYNSEMYERWQVWILLPRIGVKLNKKGEATDLTWDQNAEPRRYVLECVGDITGPTVVVRFSESPYWNNGIPFVDAHSHKDDSGWYHRGNKDLLKDNMLQEQTAKGQLMDNRTLRTLRPMIRLVGRAKDKDMRVTVNKVFDVTSPDAIQFMDIPDITQTISQTLKDLKDESEAIGQTPPFFLGEAMGSRTSATEFSAIRDQSSAPALNDIKDINMQLIGGWMRKVKEYAPQFMDRDMAVSVTGPQGQEAYRLIHAEDFNADMVLQDVAVQEFENKQTARQIIINLIQVLAQPAIAPFISMAAVLERLFKTFNSIFPNPEELINKDPQTMALIRQYIAQQIPPDDQAALGAGLPGNGQQPLQGIPSPMQPPNITNIGSLMPPNPTLPPQFTGAQESQPMSSVAGQMRGM